MSPAYWADPSFPDVREVASLAFRFWAKVERSDPDACWQWLGASTWAPHDPERRYGVIWYRGRHVRVHQLALAFAGRVPRKGEEVDHLCRNTLCVNPDHLEWVSPATNTLRSNNPTALNARKTHCKRGHALSGDNLFLDQRGQRNCRICSRDTARRSRERAAARKNGGSR